MEHTCFTFSVGNSTRGPIGYVTQICATSAENALSQLKTMLPAGLDVTKSIDNGAISKQQGYFSVYFNAHALTIDDIEDAEPCSCATLVAEAA